jgi:cytochrome c oxidase subunit I+III
MVATAVERLERSWHHRPGIVTSATSVDHKTIGVRYLVTALAFFAAGGVEAILVRSQLARPDESLVGPATYNGLFTMHGLTMIFLFVTPMLTGAFGNYLVPLMIGARDMAFPRMNALSYWIYLASGIFIYSSFLVGTPPNDGWFNYVPLSEKAYTPGHEIDFYNLGLIFLTISSTVGAINFIVTIMRMRAPGMSINRLPLFCWAILATSASLVFALPALTAANVMLSLERDFGWHFFQPESGGDPLLWQHLFWLFGHPDVYIIFLPAVGIVSAIVPIAARRPILLYPYMALATVATAFIGFGVWVHHMFATGLPQVTLAFFSAASLVIAIPSGVQVFSWIGTIWSGRPLMRAPLLYVIGFLVTFVIGGLTGVMFAVIPFDQQVTDSYFVVAHFHYVLFGGAVFPIFAGLHHWLPKITGRMYHERFAQATFWLLFASFNLTFFPMHIAGLLGMPRRVYTYPSGLGWDVLNLLETIGSYGLSLAIVAMALNFAWSLRSGEPAGDDPWHGNTLEWSTSSPPPPYNFATIPLVRSADPNWDRDEGESGDRTLSDGHNAMATTVLDADADKVLEMPHGSVWPLVLAGSLAVLFTVFLAGHWVLALLAASLVALSLAGWFSQEPLET